MVLDMFYVSQPGTEIAVQHPEITKQLILLSFRPLPIRAVLQ